MFVKSVPSPGQLIVGCTYFLLHVPVRRVVTHCSGNILANTRMDCLSMAALSDLCGELEMFLRVRQHGLFMCHDKLQN